MGSSTCLLVSAFLLLTLLVRAGSANSGASQSVERSTTENLRSGFTVRQTTCRRTCRTNRRRARRICRRAGCGVRRCRIRTEGSPTVRGWRCFAPTPSPSVMITAMPTVPPTPTPTPVVVPPTVAPTPLDRIVFCSTSTQLLLGVPTTMDGVTGIVFFRTYGFGNASGRDNEAECLLSRRRGFNERDALDLAELDTRAGCRPQTTCMITAGVCTCPPNTRFCFIGPLNRAINNKC